MRLSSYKELNVWKKSMAMAEKVYLATVNFPKEETYGLTSQIRRSAVSVPSNIAEGHSRTTKEFMQFIRVSIGSISEMETQMILANKLGYLKPQDFEQIVVMIDELDKMLRSMHVKLKQKI